MFLYNLHLAWLSIKRTPVLSSLMVAAIAVGIAVCMTIITVYRLMANDPIPHKSDIIFTQTLDLRDASPDDNGNGPDLMSYQDAQNLLKSDIPSLTSIHYQTVAVIKSSDQNLRPFRSRIRLATGDFFSLFDTPFLFGNRWSADDEKTQQQVVVITRALNIKLFGGSNSVGQKIQIAGQFFNIVGVLDDWVPTPQFFEIDSGAFSETEGAFIPFSLVPTMELRKSGGSTACYVSETKEGWQGFLTDECAWLHMWVQLDTPVQQKQWEAHLDNYVEQQREFGRFPRELNNHMYNVMQWLDFKQVVSNDYIMLLGLAFMFLGVCLFNTVGLMLSQSIRRRGEVSVRRALGGSKLTLFYQHMVEASVIGLAGGFFGLLLAQAGLAGVRALYRNFEFLTQMNLQLVAITFGLSILSSLLAGLLPTWRVCQLAPAQYLKTQ
jgi:putative ABC transport system permease protein